MVGFDIAKLRETVKGIVHPAISTAVPAGVAVTFADGTLFEAGGVLSDTVEVLVIPEGFRVDQSAAGLLPMADFAVALRSGSEATTWAAASGLYAIASRHAVEQVSVAFIAPEEAEEPEYLADCRLSIQP